jgi:hypothetical protein
MTDCGILVCGRLYKLTRSQTLVLLLVICFCFVGDKILHLPTLETVASPPAVVVPAAVARCRKKRGQPLPSPGIRSLHLYHISKCGGSTLNNFFTRGGLSAAGKAVWKGEMEDRPFMEYRHCSSPPNTKCAPVMKKPDGTFIVGTVRNPYDYYVSYWLHHLRVAEAQPSYRGCEEREAEKEGLLQTLYHPSNRGKPAAFRRWLKWVLVDTADTCGIGMWKLYRRMYLEHDDPQPETNLGTAERTYQYDVIVRTENLVEDLKEALIIMDCQFGWKVSGPVNWGFFNRWREDAAAKKKGSACILCERGNSERTSFPYSCYYDQASTELVRTFDDELLRRHQYQPSPRDHCEAE